MKGETQNQGYTFIMRCPRDPKKAHVSYDSLTAGAHSRLLCRYECVTNQFIPWSLLLLGTSGVSDHSLLDQVLYVIVRGAGSGGMFCGVRLISHTLAVVPEVLAVFRNSCDSHRAEDLSVSMHQFGTLARTVNGAYIQSKFMVKENCISCLS